MGDTFKVTTAALNGFVNDKLRPLANTIHTDPNVKQLTEWSTASTGPLKAGNGTLGTELGTEFTGFAKRMSDGSDGISRETDQLAQNVEDVGQHFHATDQNAEWSVQQVQGLLYDIGTETGPSA